MFKQSFGRTPTTPSKIKPPHDFAMAMARVKPCHDYGCGHGYGHDYGHEPHGHDGYRSIITFYLVMFNCTELKKSLFVFQVSLDIPLQLRWAFRNAPLWQKIAWICFDYPGVSWSFLAFPNLSRLPGLSNLPWPNLILPTLAWPSLAFPGFSWSLAFAWSCPIFPGHCLAFPSLSWPGLV